jgi:hypothetical protein
MDLDPPTSDACAVPADAAWPFDSLTTSLLFSSVSASPPLPSLPTNSSSWLTPPSPLWLFEDRHLLPLEPPQAPEAAVAAAVVEEVQRARSGEFLPAPAISFAPTIIFFVLAPDKKK